EDWPLAVERWQAVVAGEPENLSALAQLGQAQYRAGDAEAAQATLTRALAQGAREATVHHTLGRLAVAREEYVPAIASFRLAIEAEPKVAAYHLDLALALEAAGRLAEARVAVAEAARLAPNDAAIETARQRLGAAAPAADEER
ncbi:MAG TPA: hypothetical protein DCZ72_14370, partial [Armatimonadetes bacterium]|nr:hypothetical protein [Armatimonadota bacterium]